MVHRLGKNLDEVVRYLVVEPFAVVGVRSGRVVFRSTRALSGKETESLAKELHAGPPEEPPSDDS